MKTACLMSLRMKISQVPRDRQPPDDDEIAAQWTVMDRAADPQGERPTLADIAAEIGDRDQAARAIRELSRIGLVQVQGDYLSPSRAARRYAEMLSRVADRR